MVITLLIVLPAAHAQTNSWTDSTSREQINAVVRPVAGLARGRWALPRLRAMVLPRLGDLSISEPVA